MKMIEAILKSQHVELGHRKLCAHGVEGMTMSNVHWYSILWM
jgi:nitrogen regulatory protein PII